MSRQCKWNKLAAITKTFNFFGIIDLLLILVANIKDYWKVRLINLYFL